MSDEKGNRDGLTELEPYKNIIVENDPAVVVKTGKVMSENEGYVFFQEDVFKYALVKNKDYYSFHSMVIYSNVKAMEDLKSRIKNAKFQKGCVNIKDLSALSLEAFREHIKIAAACDFSFVIDLYHRKQKKK